MHPSLGVSIEMAQWMYKRLDSWGFYIVSCVLVLENPIEGEVEDALACFYHATD